MRCQSWRGECLPPGGDLVGVEPLHDAGEVGCSGCADGGKPGLDGHSNGAEQIAFRARDCGMDIAYEGIRLTPEEIVNAAMDQDAHVVGLSILSGSHIPLLEELMERMKAAGLGHIPVVAGGIIPDEDATRLRAIGVAKVYTPKDFELNVIMEDIVTLVDPKAVAAE
mgnify:CR=1 FL=1